MKPASRSAYTIIFHVRDDLFTRFLRHVTKFGWVEVVRVERASMEDQT